MCECETRIDIEDYAHMKEAWMKTFLELPNGVPSNDTYRRLMERISPEILEMVYRSWVSWIETVKEWKQLSLIICVTRSGERDGHQTEETACYISSREWEAEEVAKVIQGHWSIENNLHWALDVEFHEDGRSSPDVLRSCLSNLFSNETALSGGLFSIDSSVFSML